MKNSKNIFSLGLASNIKLALKSLMLVSVVALSGCSWLFGEEGHFPGQSNDYLKAEQSADIV